MVNSDESPMHLAKLLGLRNSLTNKTNDFVFNLVSKLPQTMNVEYVLKDCVKFLSPNIRKAVLLKLLSTKKLSMRLERDDEDMKLFMIPALALLLETDSNVEVLDLTGYVSHCPRTRRYVLLELAINYVSARATNLLSLSILKEGCFRENMPGMQVFNRNYMQAFVKLEHLQVLRIEEFEIDVQDLMWLCEKLRHLRFVSVNISEHYFNIPTLEELRDSFQFLKAFFFRSTASVQHILEFRNLCKMYLPNLQVIMGFASDFCSQREYQYAPHMKKERNLRHLGLNFQYEKADKDVHFMFPRVTHLMIEGPDKFSNNEWQIKPLLKFSISEIESLHLSHVPPEIVLQFVTTYGPNLHSLFLGNSICLKDSESSLDRIFELCPKLERVGLVDVKGPVIPMSCFTMLKEVILKYETVSDILIAPNLEKVTLIGQVVNKDDMRKLTDLISEKKSLRKLKTLVVRMQCHSIAEVKQPFFLALVDFVKTAARVLPAITEIQFRINYKCDFLILAESMMSGRYTNDEISGVEPFFKNLDDIQEFEWFADEDLMETLKLRFP